MSELRKGRAAIRWLFDRQIMFGILGLLLANVISRMAANLILSVPVLISGGEFYGSDAYLASHLCIWALLLPRSAMTARWALEKAMPWYMR